MRLRNLMIFLAFLFSTSVYSQYIEYNIFRTKDNITFEKAEWIFRNNTYINLKPEERTSEPEYTYWMRINTSSLTEGKVIRCSEYLDYVTFFYRDTLNNLVITKSGFKIPLWQQEFINKGRFFVPPIKTFDGYVYFKIKSDHPIGMGFELLKIKDIINSSIYLYFLFGSFIGVCWLLLIYYLVLYIQFKDKLYLFYSLYLLSFSFFAAQYSGIGTFIFYKYTWDFVYVTIPYVCMTISLLLYSKYYFKNIYDVKNYGKLVNILLVVRALIFIYAVISKNYTFHNQLIDNILLLIPFFINLLYGKFNRNSINFFSLAFTTIFLGFVCHSFGLIGSNSIFIFGYVEILFFAIAITEKFRIINKENEQEKLKTIETQKVLVDQLLINEKLTKKLNTELEIMVEEKTHELKVANAQLIEQSQKIQELNSLLVIENKTLASEIKEISQLRVMKKNVTYNEFTEIFPSEESCLKLLSELKWSNGFSCRRCKYTQYYSGSTPLSKKCKNCLYQESAKAYTLFDHIKFPIQKAFFIVFYMFNNKNPNILSLSKILELRHATCFIFSQRVVEHIQKYKPKKGEVDLWTNLLYEH